MFSKANERRVWWPVELVEYDAEGNEVKRRFTLLFHPYTRAEMRDRRKSLTERAGAGARQTAQEIAAKHSALGEGATDPASEAARLESIAQDVLSSMLATIDQQFTAQEDDVALLLARTYDWRFPKVEGKEPVPFDREWLRDLLEDTGTYSAVVSAFEECCRGAPRKNSSPGPAGTQGQARA